jgi:alpha-tubulin suppressor-like RCC1 family protein
VVAVDQMSHGDLSGAHVSCGQFTSYVAARGAVYVWGNNHAGQLGVSTETQDSIHLISKKQKDTGKHALRPLLSPRVCCYQCLLLRT